MSTQDNGIQSHKELQALLRQKEAAVRAKGRLVDNMAYQIRTLSNAVIGFSDLLLTEDLNSELTEYVTEINQAGNGLSALVNEVLDWARLESGRLQVTKTKANLSRIISDLEKIASSAASDKGLGYEIQTDPSLPAYIISDQERLLKCLINLTANAFKYTQEGSVCIRVLPEQRDGQDFIRFDVIDHGVGISPEKMGHLFEPALQEEEVHEEVLTMLDMGFTVTAGLPLTKQLIEVLGGTLEVTSQLNQGSTFSVILPVGLTAAERSELGRFQPTDPAPEEAVEAVEEALPMVLLVEDQPSNRTVISLMLEAIGVRVETAEDGVIGVEKASQGSYDLILMDLKMPRMDGYEATRQIRSQQVEVPIVALSAKVLNDAENHQIAEMFDEFLTKPVDSQKLSETVRKFIAAFQCDDTAELPEEACTEEVVTFEYGI